MYICHGAEMAIMAIASICHKFGVLHCNIVPQGLRNGVTWVECKEKFSWIEFEGFQKDQKLNKSIE